MKFHIAHALAVFTFLVMADSAFAADSKARIQDKNTLGDSLEPKFGELENARSRLGRQVKGLGSQAFGTVQDLVLDLETGHVALAVIGIASDKGSNSAFVALPMIVLENDGQDFQIRSSVTEENLTAARKFKADTLATIFNRAWAMVEYSTFGSKPYWAENKLADNDDFDRESYRLALLSELRDQVIVDGTGEPIGTIDDFAVSKNSGLIAYGAVRLDGEESGKRFPLPLGAFVVPESDQPWQVELDSKTIRNTPSFSTKQWPPKLERTWVEYVHVRYGRSPLGGVQHAQPDEGDCDSTGERR